MASLSEEAQRHWEIYGYDPYNEEHYRYVEEKRKEEENLRWMGDYLYLKQWMDECEGLSMGELYEKYAGWHPFLDPNARIFWGMYGD